MVGSQDNLLTYGCIQIRLSNHTITPQETFYKFNNAHGYSYRNRDKSKTLCEYLEAYLILRNAIFTMNE